MLGLAKHSVGDSQAAVAELQSSISFGRMDHELWAALLELGKLAFETRSYPQAAGYFKEATINGGLYNSYDIIEEAVRWGVRNQSAGGCQECFQGLLEIANYARLESEWLMASALYQRENAAVEESQQARSGKESEQRSTGQRWERSEIKTGLLFVNALSAFQSDLVSGQQQMAKLQITKQRLLPVVANCSC